MIHVYLTHPYTLYVKEEKLDGSEMTEILCHIRKI